MQLLFIKEKKIIRKYKIAGEWDRERKCDPVSYGMVDG